MPFVRWRDTMPYSFLDTSLTLFTQYVWVPSLRRWPLPPFGSVPPPPPLAPLLNLEGPWAVPVTYIPDPLPPCSGNAARVTDSDLNRPTRALLLHNKPPPNPRPTRSSSSYPTRDSSREIHG